MMQSFEQMKLKGKIDVMIWLCLTVLQNNMISKMTGGSSTMYSPSPKSRALEIDVTNMKR